MNIGMALEYSLGHITHAQNLKRSLTEDTQGVNPYYIELDYHDQSSRWSKLPGIRSNWSLRASLGAYLGLRRQARQMDKLLFHTQVTSLLSVGLMRQAPSVISLDATPLQYDALGASYGHQPSSNTRVEEVKMRLNQRAFGAAKRLVTWSQWAKDSLVADYQVPADKITVIPPGIDFALWSRNAAGKIELSPRRNSEELNLLFVGGSFARKGGDTLLEAFENLPPSIKAHLYLVTRDDVSEAVNACMARSGRKITLLRNIEPNSERLRQLFAEADLFVFPTRGDCLPLAILEAMASGLPIITTAVGALPEAVHQGVNGLVVPPGDPAALLVAMENILSSDEVRLSMGCASRARAARDFDAATNYRRLLETVKTA
jgi:glycosyltransferase involved in cell wall biosynthesis